MAGQLLKTVWAGAVLMLLTTGCAHLPDWAAFSPLHDSSATAAKGAYSFSWRLSGDRQAGPLQVFDNGRNTWLQFAPDQPMPAIFARQTGGDTLVQYRRQGPYVVLDGVWPLLVLRAGRLESHIERVADTASNPKGLNEADLLSRAMGREEVVNVEAANADAASTVAVSVELTQAEPASITAANTAVIHNSGTKEQAQVVIAPPPSPHTGLDAVLNHLRAGASESSLASSNRVDLSSAAPTFTTHEDRAGPMGSYQVSPDDGNIRLALVRWSALSGWTFGAEHWAVDVDIPIVAAATFDLAFDEAVQQLLASTELSDRPLQPCFYANKVLRVVPYAQNCDRTATLVRV